MDQAEPAIVELIHWGLMHPLRAREIDSAGLVLPGWFPLIVDVDGFTMAQGICYATFVAFVVIVWCMGRGAELHRLPPLSCWTFAQLGGYR